MINFKKNNIRFIYRIAGITIHNNRVLLQRMIKDDFWALPGGRCELLENSRNALVREYKEEINIDVVIGNPLFFVENFFNFNNEQYHEISLILKVLFPQYSEYLKINEFKGDEEGLELIFKWFDLKKLDRIELYPTFLRKELISLPNELKHIIHKDK